jgi:hypothetical protein
MPFIPLVERVSDARDVSSSEIDADARDQLEGADTIATSLA